MNRDTDLKPSGDGVVTVLADQFVVQSAAEGICTDPAELQRRERLFEEWANRQRKEWENTVGSDEGFGPHGDSLFGFYWESDNGSVIIGYSVNPQDSREKVIEFIRSTDLLTTFEARITGKLKRVLAPSYRTCNIHTPFKRVLVDLATGRPADAEVV